ncbi:MAG: cation:proton antiporter [Caldilinea sp.]|nr:cation:proton antiporter [Caldilineaceae bacterium]MCB9121391.1 cation:proton antiporter [Caldilineaceae bacterium]MCO5212789.1 cation:proton antiporter [Caldilinea sp.]
MSNAIGIVAVLLSFLILAMASRQIGALFARFRLPLISGFLFTGILVGPFVLGLLPKGVGEELRFVDEISLAIIAFAAGAELYLRELRSRMKSILWVTAGNVIAIPLVVAVVLFLLSGWLPYLEAMPVAARAAVAALAGTILIARSPSSAIAIINELRARGPFTQMVLGVTMITDVLVIALFAVNSSVVDALLSNLPFDLQFVGILLLEIAIEVGLGYLVGRLLALIMARHAGQWGKGTLLVIIGFGVFTAAHAVRDFSAAYLPFELFLEPLLICLIASFVLANYTPYRTEFMRILEEVSPPIYVVFFTLTGASLALDVLAQTWPIAVALFLARLVAIYAGSFAGGVAARDPMPYNRMSWMTFITQAGVGLGLAKEVSVAYPEWGGSFATLVISVIVVSQLVGPPLFKAAINRVGEAHGRGHGTAGDDREWRALIFGLEGQSVALARLLTSQGWHVRIASRQAGTRPDLDSAGVNITPIQELSLETMHALEAERADAIVTMLSNAENTLVCQTAYEHFGTERLVARMSERDNFDQLRALGVIIVEPSTAMVGLLDQFVRTPVATSLLLGMEEHQSIVDIEMRNPALEGLMVRELRLPLDVLILSIRRGGGMLVSHGYSRLQVGDWITVVGSPESLEIVTNQFVGVPGGVTAVP